MLKERDTYTYGVNTGMPVTYESSYLSAGLGLVLSRGVSLDIAYQNVSDKMNGYQLFFSQDYDTGDLKTWSGVYETSLTRHYIAMTLNFRF